MKHLFLSFFEISISTSLVVLALLMLAPLFNRRYASKWKYYIWIALAFRLLIPLNLNPSIRQVVINIPEPITAPVITNTETAIPIILQAGQSVTGIALLDFIAIIWLVICLCLLFIHLLSFLHFKIQIIRRGTYVENKPVLHQLITLQRELQIKSKISLITYSGAISPMMIGFFRPILVLPDNEYSQEELYFIIKHELVHVKRHDVFFKLLFVIVNSIHWFNPLIYMMQKAANIDMELSCDERVIQGTSYAVRKAYTETLLSSIHKQYNKANGLTTQFYGGNQIMKKRFENILLKSKKKNGFSILVCTILITVFLGMITGCSIMESTTLTTAKEDKLLNENPDNNVNVHTVPTQTPETTETEPNSTNHPEDAFSEDAQEIKQIAENFATAYFRGDKETVQSCLTNPYNWDIEVYEGLDTTGAGTISELNLKGITDIIEEEIGSIQVLSLEFRDSNYEDMLIYLTLEFVKQENGWRIQFYGLEG